MCSSLRWVRRKKLSECAQPRIAPQGLPTVARLLQRMRNRMLLTFCAAGLCARRPTECPAITAQARPRRSDVWKESPVRQPVRFRIFRRYAADLGKDVDAA